MIAEGDDTDLTLAGTDIGKPVTRDRFVKSFTELTEKQQKFLEAYAACAVVAAAARRTKTSEHTHYHWRRNDPRYRFCVKFIQSTFGEILEATAFERAIDGWEEPVFFKDEQIGTKTKFDNRLLETLLKKHKKKYADPKSQTNVNINNEEGSRATVQIMLPSNGRTNTND